MSRATLREMQRARSAFAPARRVAVAGRAARRDRRRLRLRPDDLARARRAAACRSSRRPARLRHADALGARARPQRDPARERHLRASASCPLRRALALVAREAALPRRVVRAARRACWPRATRSTVSSSAGTTPRRRVCSRPTSTSTSRWRSGAPSSRRLRERHGALRRDGELEPEDALRGRWRLRGERGHVDLDDHDGPDRPAARADARASNPCCRPPASSRRSRPRPSTSRASRAARRSTRCSRRRVDADEALRGLQVAAALYGPFGDRASRSRATARRRPRCACRASAATSSSSSRSTPAAGASRASCCAPPVSQQPRQQARDSGSGTHHACLTLEYAAQPATDL